MTAPHRVVNPPELGPAVGFSHAVVSGPGRHVHLGGQVAQGPDGVVAPGSVVEQFDIALGNVVTALRAAGAAPEHLVRLVVYTTVPDDYRAALSELGAVYRSHLGRHYPAMAFFAVAGLFDPDAVVELVGTAVVPESDS